MQNYLTYQLLTYATYVEPKSKRTPVRLRHKIEKASAAKQRKQRKLAKKVQRPRRPEFCLYAYQSKNPQWRSRLKKDPGIPNLFPYKDKILQEIEEKKRLKEEEAVGRREEARARREGGSEKDTGLETAMERPGEQEAASADADLVDDEMEEVRRHASASTLYLNLLASARRTNPQIQWQP